MAERTKRCSHCHAVKPISEFHKNRSAKDGLDCQCKKCKREAVNQSHYRLGKRKPLGSNPDCPCFLGVHVAERVLRHVYKHVKQMPCGHPGFDFVCNRGYKIDVKSACRRHRKKQADWWEFAINKNTTADHFLCIAFDSREDLNPEHVWLLPGNLVNDHIGVSVSENRIEKWLQYEL